MGALGCGGTPASAAAVCVPTADVLLSYCTGLQVAGSYIAALELKESPSVIACSRCAAAQLILRPCTALLPTGTPLAPDHET